MTLIYVRLSPHFSQKLVFRDPNSFGIQGGLAMKSLFLRSVLVITIILFPAWEMNGSAQSSDSHLSHDGSNPAQSSLTTIRIPGPRRSFLRMAAISRQVSPDEVLPLLAHNVAVEGYTYNRKGRRPNPTEYLTL